MAMTAKKATENTADSTAAAASDSGDPPGPLTELDDTSHLSNKRYALQSQDPRDRQTPGLIK